MKKSNEPLKGNCPVIKLEIKKKFSWFWLREDLLDWDKRDGGEDDKTEELSHYDQFHGSGRGLTSALWSSLSSVIGKCGADEKTHEYNNILTNQITKHVQTVNL